MSICIPNKQDQLKFDVLVAAVGEQEAVRDYFEQNETVRPPKVVMQKLMDRLAPQEEVEVMDEMFKEALRSPGTNDVTDAIQEIQKAIAAENRQAAQKIMNRLSESLGIDYEIISVDQSRAMRGSQEDVPGFYQSGKVYFTEGMFTPETVLHEFSHPLIKALAKTNTELFNNLYNELIGTADGLALKEEVLLKYPELINKPDLLKEEVLVHAMEKMKMSDPAAGFLAKILFALRQMLRSIFKTDVSKLSPTTTLTDLSKMLNAGDVFALPLEMLREDDIIMLKKEFDNMMQVVDKNAAKVAQELINDMYELIKTQVSASNIENSVFAKMAGDGFTTEDNKALIQIMRRTMEVMATDKSRKAVKSMEHLLLDKEHEEIAKRLAAVIDTVVKSEQIFDLLAKKYDTLKDSEMKSSEDIDGIYAVSQYVDRWMQILDNLVDTGYESIFSDGEGGDNALRTKIHAIRRTGRSLQSTINDKKFEGVVDILYAEAKNNGKALSTWYLSEMDKLRSSGNMKDYDRMHTEYYGLSVSEMDEYNQLKAKKDSSKYGLNNEDTTNLTRLQYMKDQAVEINRESIAHTIAGMSSDVNFMNNMFESYSQSQDKVVGSFHDFIRKNMNTVNGNSNARQQELLNALQPLIAKTKWGTARHLGDGGLGKAISQVSNIGTINNQENRVDDFQGYKFLSNFKDFEADRLRLTHALELAKNEYVLRPTDENWDDYLSALEEFEDWNRDYMHQQYTPEFYDRQKLFRDEIGKKARKRLDAFFAEMNEMTDLIPLSFNDFSVSEQVNEKWREYQWLHNLYNPDGTEKTGEEKEIAQRLIDYRNASQEFYEWVDQPGAFQDAYNEYVDQLTEAGKGPGTKDFDAAIDVWLTHNTVIQVDEAYYTQRKNLMDERSEIIAPLAAINNDIQDVTPLYDKLYALSKPTKDHQGQFDGTQLSADVQKQIKDLHQQIEDARRSYYMNMGITLNELEEYYDLVDMYNYDPEMLSDEQQNQLQEFRDRIKQGLTGEMFGLSEAQVQRLMEIDEALREMSFTNNTSHYRDTFVGLIDGNEDSAAIFDEWLPIERGDGDIVTDRMIDDLLKDEKILNQIRSLNPEFNSWFENNHYAKRKSVKDKDGSSMLMDVMTKTKVWEFTAPASMSYYKGFALEDAAGNTIGMLNINGVPRVPSMKYKDRVVKDQFVTKRIERDYVDANGNLVLANVNNKGEFLPKTLGQGAKGRKYIDDTYMEMFNEDRDMWNLLDAIKNFHLDSQRGLENNQKLGLNFPSARKKGLERFTPFSPKGMALRFGNSIKQTFVGQADDFNYGLNVGTVGGKKGKYELDHFQRPVYGTFELDLVERSTDVLDLVMQYQHSVDMNKAMRKVHSLGNTLQNLLNEQLVPNAIKKLRADNEFLAKVTTDKDVQLRAKIVGDIMDRYVEGISIKSMHNRLNSTMRLGHTVVGSVMKASSRKFFFFNWISDLTNPISGRIQFSILALDGKNFFNYKNWAVGERKSIATMKNILAKSYSIKTKPLDVQLTQIMDASPDLFTHSVGEGGSRTALQDMYEMRWGYAVRTTVQHQLNIAAFYALLDNKKYRFQIDGKGPFVTLDKSVQLVNGKLETIPGVPQEYQITYDKNGDIVLGDKIQKIMNHHKSFLLKSTGMAGKLSESEFANRYLLGKMMLFVFRFLPAMAIDRYQVKTRKELNTAGENRGFIGNRAYYAKQLLTGKAQRRINRDAQIAQMGMYFSVAEMMRRIVTGEAFKGGATNMEQWKGVMQVAMTVVIELLIQQLITGLVFNTDDDDPENDFYFDEETANIYKHLRATTALPELPGVDRKFSIGEYDRADYFKLQMLRLGLRARRENATFAPWQLAPIAKDIAFMNGPIGEGALNDVSNMAGILWTAASTGEWSHEDNLIGEDSGPYSWGRKGEHKFWNLLGRFYGLNGNMINPAGAIETEANFAKNGSR
jgi:hypothetical protein